MSEIEENKKLAWRWMDLISAHKIEELCELVAPDWEMHGGPPALPRGAEGIRELFRTIGEVRQKWTIEDTIAEGSKVVVRATNLCEQASFFGVPGKGIVQKFTATFTHQIAGGKILVTWRNADDLGRIFQLGGRIAPAV
ncbi:MAG TPA: nuclear transport factor 2 family protein [Pyrinomonadaceae bacterium]|jgi:hypothetical protein